MLIKFSLVGVKLLKEKHEAFVLLESITALMISLMIIFTLTLCVSEQFKLLNRWEQRVNAHKIMLLHLSNQNMRDPIIVKNQKYYFRQQENKYQVRVNGNVYQMQF